MSQPAAAAASSPDLKDRFMGAMLGAVVGDALGAPLEFRLNRN